LSSAATLLILSPASVPRRLDRAAWEGVLQHVAGHATPPVGVVLLGECPYPRLLERARFFRWADGSRETLRAIERWIVGLDACERPAVDPAALPWFEGREREIELLWETLVDAPGGLAWIEGPPGAGKTCLAQTFARQAGDHFRDVLWVACGERSAAAVAADLEDQLRGALLAEHRVLLVFDDVTGVGPPLPPPGGRASVLVTARTGCAAVPAHAQTIGLDPLPPAPIEPLVDSAELGLWQAMAMCRPQGLALEFAAGLAQVPPAAAEGLIRKRLVDPLDYRDSRLRLSALSRALAREGADIGPLRRRRAEHLHGIFRRAAETPQTALACLPELPPSLDWACRADWELAGRLAWRAFAFLRVRGRFAEGAETLRRLRDEAAARQDLGVVDACTYELSWAVDGAGAPCLRPDASEQLTLQFSS
jgi:hypothetical protein